MNYNNDAGYIMGMMKKQGELSSENEAQLFREGLDQKLVGPIDREALQVDMPRKGENTIDANFDSLAEQRDY